MARKWCTNSFIIHCTEIHNNKYDYTNTIYVRSSDKVIIICPIHGEFAQIAKSHIRGNGCKQCAMELVQKNNKKCTEQVIKEFNKVHMNNYDYSKVEYVNDSTEIKIICSKHGEFEQIPVRINRAVVVLNVEKNSLLRKELYLLSSLLKMLLVFMDISLRIMKMSTLVIKLI